MVTHPTASNAERRLTTALRGTTAYRSATPFVERKKLVFLVCYWLLNFVNSLCPICNKNDRDCCLTISYPAYTGLIVVQIVYENKFMIFFIDYWISLIVYVQSALKMTLMLFNNKLFRFYWLHCSLYCCNKYYRWVIVIQFSILLVIANVLQLF